MNSSLVYNIPEFEISEDFIAEIKQFADDDSHFKYSLSGFYGRLLPYYITEYVNHQIKLDLSIFNNSKLMFRWPQLIVMDAEHPGYKKHIDARREAALNLMIEDPGCFETVFFVDGEEIVIDYSPTEFTLLNAQVPHEVRLKDKSKVGRRLLLSYCVTMSYDRFLNLYKQNKMFQYDLGDPKEYLYQ